MKKSALSLRIDEPCHENWSDMTPVERGRFCNSCQKTVTDFSTMTDNEILAVMQNSGDGICGKFYSTQLNRTLVQTQLSGKSWKLNSAFTALFLATGAAALSAQTTTPQNNQTVIIDEKNPTGPVCIRAAVKDTSHYTLDAIVIDSTTGKPCPNAVVTLAGTTWQAIADSAGHVVLNFPDSLAGETIRFNIHTASGGFDAITLAAERINQTRELLIDPEYIMVFGQTSIIREIPASEVKKSK